MDTLRALMPGAADGIRAGGEDQRQYAEFLRGRRLAAAAGRAAGRPRNRAAARLTVADAQEMFTRRLIELGHADAPVDEVPDDGPSGARVLAAELADSWSPRDAPTLYPLCSPHKAASTLLHLRDFYQDGFAAQLVSVLPDWVRFLAGHTGMSADLTDRCLAYASGERQPPGMLDGRGHAHIMARVVE